MKKSLYAGALWMLIVGVQPLGAVQRVVLAEEFTATWCPYCPGAARGLHDLEQVAGDTLAVIAYHLNGSVNDPFTVQESMFRYGYYGDGGIPRVYFNGVYAVVGGSYNGSMFPQYHNYYNFLKTEDQPIAFTLGGTYAYNLREGTIDIQLENTGTEAITANLRTAIVLTDTPYTWQNMTELEWVLRDMIPSAYGVPISLDAGATWDTSLAFSIPTNVSDNKIQFVVFVQQDPTRVVYGASKIDLLEFSWVGVEEEVQPQPPRVPFEVIRRGSHTFEVWNRPEAGEVTEVEIWNVSGQRIFQSVLSPGERTTLSLLPGVYLYRASASGRLHSEGKLISFP